MSQINTNAILDASGGTSTTVNGYTPTASNMAGRNRIINGDMRIDQRNAGASVTPTAWTYTVDRWQTEISQASKLSFQQNAGSVTPPAGFTNYLGVTSLSAYSVGAGDYFDLNQPIEGFNVADLGWGTAGAKPVTVSFWVRSSITGTHSAMLANSANTRSYPFNYTVSAANTWEYKTITIPGDTSGTWLTNNGAGIQLRFSLGGGSTYRGTAGSWAGADYRAGATGSVNIVETSGATFYITGVQLEEGSVATPFEHRQYGQELALCQRYCVVLKNEDTNNQRLGYGHATSSVTANIAYTLPVKMRTGPSLTINDISKIRLSDGFAATTPTAYSILGAVNGSLLALVAYTTSGLTQFRPYWAEGDGVAANTGILTFSSEL